MASIETCKIFVWTIKTLQDQLYSLLYSNNISNMFIYFFYYYIKNKLLYWVYGDHDLCKDMSCHVDVSTQRTSQLRLIFDLQCVADLWLAMRTTMMEMASTSSVTRTRFSSRYSSLRRDVLGSNNYNKVILYTIYCASDGEIHRFKIILWFKWYNVVYVIYGISGMYTSLGEILSVVHIDE